MTQKRGKENPWLVPALLFVMALGGSIAGVLWDGAVDIISALLMGAAPVCISYFLIAERVRERQREG